MSAQAAATNRNRQTASSPAMQRGGISVNAAIPVGSMETWRTDAIMKVSSFSGLPDNWDSHGSSAPSWGLRQYAVDFLLGVPSVGAPRIVPVSGGGYHFEWSVGNRDLEVSIEPNFRVEALRVENGMPLEENPPLDFSALFSWLASR
jgi:hypothetical protein